MSERPGVVLGWLLGTAVVLAALLLAGLASLGVSHIANIALVTLGTFTACFSFVSELRQMPVFSFVLVVLTILSSGALIRSMIGYWRQRRILVRLPLIRVDGNLAAIVADGGGAQLYRTPAKRPAAFCYGLLRPRIIATEGLLDQLDAEELRATLYHEAYHVRDRAPLKCFVAHLAVASFFWIPVLADLFERYLLVKELAADREAEARTSRHALAGALWTVCDAAPTAGAIGMADFAALRIDRLFDPAVPLPRVWRLPRLVSSAVPTFILGLVVVFPGQLDLPPSCRLGAMLTDMSLHGLPGMTVGLIVNTALVALATPFIRRVVRDRLRLPQRTPPHN